MKYSNVAIVILLIASIMACSKSSKVPAQEGSTNNPSTTQTPPTTQLSQGANNSTTNSNTTSSLKEAETTTLAAVNPPHGQPNHRCDIAVGAPLNSPAGTGLQQKNAVQPTSLQPNVSVLPAPNTTASTAATAPGMNPPHGQPGHRCDIKVGAPLPAAPATTK